MSLRQTPTLTPAMLAANRRNAQKSTGPRTEEGKRRVTLNGLKHGLRSSSFRDSLVKSGESTALVDRNFLFYTLLLRPQKRHEVRRIAQLVRALWSVTHWGRRHEVRAGRPERLLKNALTELHLDALLDAAEQRVRELEQRVKSGPADLGLQSARETGLVPSPSELGAASPDGSDPAAWVSASQASREASLGAQPDGKSYEQSRNLT